MSFDATSSLRDRLMQAVDLDAAAAIAQAAGFNMRKEEWFRHQSQLDLSDAELASVAGCDNSAGIKCCHNQRG